MSQASNDPTVRTDPVVAFPPRGHGAVAARDDRVAVEAPLELRVGGRTSTVLMRTPGADEELVAGFLFAEGVIASRRDLVALERPEELPEAEVGNVLVVTLSRAVGRRTVERSYFGSSSCGVCGKLSIAELAVEGAPLTCGLRLDPALLQSLPDAMRTAQPTFQATGGVHASALFDATGRLLALREDVGRHNALDKLVGWGVLGDALPFADRVLVVSGRASYELLQKAYVAGIPFVVAVGAPSTYAVDLARRLGITLVGFVKRGSMNVYAGPERVVGADAALPVQVMS